MNIRVSETEPVVLSGGLYQGREIIRYNMHFGLEMGVVLSGVQRRHWLGYSRLVGPGQAWFAGIWEPHAGEVAKAPCEVMTLLIWPPLLTQLRFAEAPQLDWLAPFVMNPSRRPRVPASKQGIILAQVNQLKGIKDPSGPVEKASIRICLLNILAQFLNPDVSSRVAAKENYYPDEKWAKLNHAVRSVFGSKAFLSTARMAKECGLNRNSFSQLFKKWMGISFGDFAMQYRIKQAADQLLGGNEQIKAIARQWGFVDVSHFNHVFLEKYGCAPSDFRRKQKAE